MSSVAARREYQKRWNTANAESRRAADRNGRPWTATELAVASRADLTDFEAAALLGRTAAAVNHARKRIKRGIADKPGQKRLHQRTREINTRENLRRAERRAADAAYKEREAALRRQHQEQTLDHAPRKGFPWTGPELEIASRKDLTAIQVASMTGRTLHAVNLVRGKLRKGIPREVLLAGVGRA